MKANDLMIGDWLLYGGKPVRVLQLSEGKEYKEFSPIPITKEILEKNGFTNANYTPDSHSKKRYSPLADSSGYWVEICIESYFEGEVKYVHELQHILRLCEREKEIEL